MKYLCAAILTFLFANGLTNVHAQMVVTQESELLPDSSAVVKNINVFVDPRLDILVEQHKKLQAVGTRRARGYRIQIYSGTDRTAAIQRKVDFMRRYPDEKTYMTYVRPQYRIRVGNFATRADAVKMYRSTISLYGACMIVPENVVIDAKKQDEEDDN